MLCDLKVLRCRFIAQSVSLALIVIGSPIQSQKTLHADQLPTSAMQAATAIQFESVQLKFKPPRCATSKVSSTLHLRRGCTTLVRTEIVTWFFLLVRMRRGSVSRATLLAFEPRENSVNKGARAARIRPRLPHCQQGQAHSLEFGLLSTYANCND